MNSFVAFIDSEASVREDDVKHFLRVILCCCMLMDRTCVLPTVTEETVALLLIVCDDL